MSKEEKESFGSRWSRRKQKAREQDRSEARVEQSDPKVPTELLPLDQLTPESDFSGFMDAKVDDGLRRAALKKLFSDPRFNVTDGLDDYAEDYSGLEALPASLVDRLQHARRTLGDVDPKERKATEVQFTEQANGQPEERLEEPRQPGNSGSEQGDGGSPKDVNERAERNS